MFPQVQRAIRTAPRSKAGLLDYEAAWAEFRAPVQKLNELKQDTSEEYAEARDMVAPKSNQAAEGAVKESKRNLDLKISILYFNSNDQEAHDSGVTSILYGPNICSACNSPHRSLNGCKW